MEGMFLSFKLERILFQIRTNDRFYFVIFFQTSCMFIFSFKLFHFLVRDGIDVADFFFNFLVRWLLFSVWKFNFLIVSSVFCSLFQMQMFNFWFKCSIFSRKLHFFTANVRFFCTFWTQIALFPGFYCIFAAKSFENTAKCRWSTWIYLVLCGHLTYVGLFCAHSRVFSYWGLGRL